MVGWTSGTFESGLSESGPPEPGRFSAGAGIQFSEQGTSSEDELLAITVSPVADFLAAVSGSGAATASKLAGATIAGGPPPFAMWTVARELTPSAWLSCGKSSGTPAAFAAVVSATGLARCWLWREKVLAAAVASPQGVSCMMLRRMPPTTCHSRAQRRQARTTETH